MFRPVKINLTCHVMFCFCLSRVLISTDVWARGIDVQQVSLVINYDLPNNRELYIHRYVYILLVIPCAPRYAFRAVVCHAPLLFWRNYEVVVAQILVAKEVTLYIFFWHICCVLLCVAWSVLNWQDMFIAVICSHCLFWNQGLTRWYFTICSFDSKATVTLPSEFSL